jgi:hypothetical protein
MGLGLCGLMGWGIVRIKRKIRTMDKEGDEHDKTE